MRVRFEIEQLRLEGLGGIDAEAFARRIGEEMERLIAARGVPPGLADGNRLRIDGERLSIEPGTPPAAAAARIARQLLHQAHGRVVPVPDAPADDGARDEVDGERDAWAAGPERSGLSTEG